MADAGWIALQRKIQKSFVWANPYVLKLWLLILFKAGYSENKFLFNGKEVRVDRGQFVTGRVALASEYNEGATREHMLSPTSINRWLKKFRDLGMVDIQSNARYSVITVINYDAYQSTGQLVDTRRTTSGQQADTIEQENKNNNISTTTEGREAANFYQANFGMLSPFNIQKLENWVSDFQSIGASESEANKILVKGMQIALTRNKRNLGYAEAIYRDWEGKGLNSVAAIDGEEAKFQADKQPSGGQRRKKPDITTEPTQDDLPF